MTQGMKPAPFATTPDAVADAVAAGPPAVGDDDLGAGHVALRVLGAAPRAPPDLPEVAARLMSERATEVAEADRGHAARDRRRGIGMRRVHLLAWRDLDDARRRRVRAARARADAALGGAWPGGRRRGRRARPGCRRDTTRDGYRVVRKGSRYTSFHRTVGAELTRSMGRYDALVEVWNGVPFLSPIWCRKPRLTVLHHVHGPMWDQLFSPRVASDRPGHGDQARPTVLPAAAPSCARRSRPARSCSRSGSDPTGSSPWPTAPRLVRPGAERSVHAARGARRRPAGAGQALRLAGARRRQRPHRGSRHRVGDRRDRARAGQHRSGDRRRRRA